MHRPWLRVFARSESAALPSLRVFARSESVALPSLRVFARSESVALPSLRVFARSESVVLPSLRVFARSEFVALPSLRVFARSESVALPWLRVFARSESVALPWLWGRPWCLSLRTHRRRCPSTDLCVQKLRSIDRTLPLRLSPRARPSIRPHSPGTIQHAETQVSYGGKISVGLRDHAPPSPTSPQARQAHRDPFWLPLLRGSVAQPPGRQPPDALQGRVHEPVHRPRPRGGTSPVLNATFCKTLPNLHVISTVSTHGATVAALP